MPWPQLGEVLRRVAPAEHVQGRFESAVRELAEAVGPADQRVHVVGLDIGRRPVRPADGGGGHHGDDLLGEHVERVAQGRDLLDGADPHPFHDDGRLDQVAAVVGEEDPAGGGAHLVSGAAHALQPAGHRRWCLHLDDDVDRSHVDAQLERGGGHHAGQLAGLEVRLDLGPLFLADRAVVRPGHDAGAGAAVVTSTRPRLGHDLGRWGVGGRTVGATGGVVPTVVSRLVGGPGLLVPLGLQLVEMSSQALGQPPRVGEHDGGVVGADQIEDLVLHVRPDRRAGRRRPVGVEIQRRGGGGGRQVAHVLHRDDDREVPRLRRRGRHHRHRVDTAEVAGDPFRRPDCR